MRASLDSASSAPVQSLYSDRGRLITSLSGFDWYAIRPPARESPQPTRDHCGVTKTWQLGGGLLARLANHVASRTNRVRLTQKSLLQSNLRLAGRPYHPSAGAVRNSRANSSSSVALRSETAQYATPWSVHRTRL